ncbi:MAG: WbqC family protein [Mucilaginibacter polytrichastri]|nr:WbqC family protein [Mucilaginibacter polytrichastri]
MSEKPAALFPLFYLPPVHWFSALRDAGRKAIVEHHEHFPKQTYRNRAHIASPNGRLTLSVPVIRGSKNHTPYKDVKISYDSNWQRLHWMSLQASYRSSSYFEFYEDDLAPFFEQRHTYLFEYNWDLLQLILGLLKMPAELHYTESYEADYGGDDWRNRISAKAEPAGTGKPYYQVFEDRHGFLPDLSIVDLLFSQGPQSQNFL